ncbi:hypothetical protein BGW80DRAFT_1451072 [Lactifluus volemus]|nr:hypothetical protein BGW80DRAFT_1451072 [Lactifluus volemus]
MPAPLPDSVPPSPLSPLTSLSSSPIVPPTMPNVVVNPGTPQTPNTPKYDPVFRPWKQKLQFATFIGSFVGKDQPLKPVPYPEMPSGERVAVSGLEDYYKKRCWEMPMCFCGLMDGMDHPALFHVPRSLRSPNYGRPIIMCSIMKCSYWGLHHSKSRRATTHLSSSRCSQLPQVEAETLPPSQARPSSPSAIRRTDTELLDYGAPCIPDIFGTNFQFQQELEAAMAPLGVEGSRPLLLMMFDPNCPGISMSEFIRVVKQCPLCKLLTSSSLMHMHRCPSPSGSGEQLNARQYEASGTIPFFSPEPKPVIEPSPEPVVVIEISSDDD